MCYEHLRFLLYKLGAAEAGDLRHFSLQVVLSEPALSLERSLAA